MKIWQTAILVWLMLCGAALGQTGTRTFSVGTYGATPDDGANDTEAIQKAIEAAEDYAIAHSTRATVFFPKGSYHITRLEIDRPNITLDGYDVRLEAVAGSGFNQILLVTGEADSETAEYIVIKGLAIDGNYPTVDNAGVGLGVNIRANHVKLLDVTVEATENDTFTSQYCQDIVYERCISRDSGETGFRIRSDYTKVLDCEVYDWNTVNSASANRAVLVDSLEYDGDDFQIKGLKAEMSVDRNFTQTILIDGGDGTATTSGTSPFANSGVATVNQGRASWKLDVGHGFLPGDGILISGTGQSAYDDISHRIYAVDGQCFVGVVDANTFKLYDTAANAVTNSATGRYNVTGTGTGDFYVKSPGGLRKLFTVADQSADTFTATAHGFTTGMPAVLTIGAPTYVLPAGLTGVATVTVNTPFSAAGTSGDYIRPHRINNVTLEDVKIFHRAQPVTDGSTIKVNNTNNLAISRLLVTQTPPTTSSLIAPSLWLGGGNRKVTVDKSVLPNGLHNNTDSWIPELTVTNSELGTAVHLPVDAMSDLQVGRLTVDNCVLRFSSAGIETGATATEFRDADVDLWTITNNKFEGYSTSATRTMRINQTSQMATSGKLVYYGNSRSNSQYSGFTFTAATTDILTATGHALETGDEVTVSTTTTLPSGLSANTTYYVRRTDDDKLTLHTTKTGASDNTARVDIASTGSGTHVLLGEHAGCILTNSNNTARLCYQRGSSGKEFFAPTVPTNTTVAYTKGDIIWQMNPVPGGSLGWTCTKTGVPSSSAGEFQEMPATETTFNVVDYGARADDLIDDTTAIQATIDAALTGDKPSVVYFPPGEYYSTRTIIDGDDLTVMAYGAIINQYASLGTTDGSCMLRILGNRNRVLGMQIDGGGQSTAQFASASYNRGIQINGGSDNVLRDCFVHNTSKYEDGTLPAGTGTGQLDHTDNVSQAADCFQVILGDNNTIVNCIAHDSGWNGIRCSGDGNRVIGCKVEDYLGRGIRFNGGESGYVIGCQVECNGIASGACILVDPEEGELFGEFVVRDCTVYNNSTRTPGTNAVKIARVRHAVIDGGDYQIGELQPEENTCIRLEDTVEHAVIQNLRADGILMTNGLFQAVAASHASAASGTQTTITIDPTSLSADTDMDTVIELLDDGDGELGNNPKGIFISGSSIPAYNGLHFLDDTTAITSTSFTIDTPYVAGTFGAAAMHDATDRLEVKNVYFGHGIHNDVTPMENIKGRIVEVENCTFDLSDNDSDDSTGATTAIEWAVPDDRAFSLFRVVNNKAHFHKNGGAIGKLIQMEELTTTLLASGKTIGYGNIVENQITGGGTPVIVNVSGNADRLKLFTTAGENTRQFTGTAAPTVGTWAAGDLIFNTTGSSQAVLFWRCATAGTPGTWEAITPTIRGALDANLGSITNGQGIAWNSLTSKFDPVTITGGTSVTTPDGLTTVTRASEFNPRDYGASGSRKIFRVTSSSNTYTTRNASGTAIAHDFRVGQGCIVPNAGAVADVSTPDHLKCFVTNSGTAGATTYTYKAVAIDADGGRSAASTGFTTTTGNATLSTTNYNIVKCDMPRNAVAIAIYKSDVLQTILDTAEPVRLGSDTVPGSFTLANNGGSIQLTVSAGHGIVTNDYVHIKTTSSGDTVYDVTAQCTNAGTTTLDFSGVAYDVTATTASGYFRNAKMEWADKGASVPLHAIKYLPGQENPPMAHRPGAAVWQGQVCWATASGTKYLYRCTRSIGTHMTGSSAPTWTTDPTVPVVDNEVTWMLEPFFVDVDAPSSAQRKTLFAKIATVPTSSTFTLDTAAGADISVSKLLCAHNDALAFKECVAAAKTYGQPATIRITGGDYSCYLPSTINTTYWSLPGAGFTLQPAFMFLNSSIRDVAHPTISIVADAAATIRGRYCQNSLIVENLGQHSDHLVNGESRFIVLATDNASIIGGEWEWGPWSGGFTEHDGGGSNSYGAHQYWLGDGLDGSSNNAATKAYGMTIRDVRVHWPSTYLGAPIIGADSDRKRNSKWLNCEIYYGGGDGDQTFLPHGDFLFDGCVMETVTRMSSHGFYFNVSNDNYRIVNSTFRRVATDAGKNCISIRGSGGDTWTSNISIDNNTFINCGRINVGDPTTSNRVHRVAISNCLGTGVVVNMAEARSVTLSGGVYGAITLSDDCKDVRISNIICDSIDLSAATETNQDIDVSGVTFREKIVVDDCTNVTVNNFRTRNPFSKLTSLISGTYAWASLTGTSTLYYLTNRATGGDPSLSSPTGVLVRDVASITATPDLLINGGTDAWFYGNIERQTIAISGTPTGTSFTITYNGNTTGPITHTTASPATAATVQTALRTLTGMSACYVSQSGTGTNLTFTVAGWAVGSDPAQMTSTATFDTGSIAHATTMAYPGYSTLVVAMGDENRYDPDSNPYGTIWTIDVQQGLTGVQIGGTVANAKFSNGQLTSTWNSLTYLVGYASAGASLTDVTYEGITTEYTGLTYNQSSTWYAWDFGGSAMALAERIKIKDCKWIFPLRNAASVGAECRLYLNVGGDVTLDGLDLPTFGSGWALANGSAVSGAVNVINCRVQTNRATYTVATDDTFTLVASGSAVDYFDTNGQPVIVDIGPGTAMPVTSPQIVRNAVYWYSNATSKLYASASDASTNTSPIDVTTANGPVTIRVLDASRLALLSTHEFLGDNTEFNVWGMCRGNTWRGSKQATYAQITADQNNYQLIPLLSEHRLSTDASRTITGFDAPAAGSVDRTLTVHNVGSFNIVYAHASGSSATGNTFVLPGATSYTQAANTSVTFSYDKVSQVWRLTGD